MGTRKRHTAEQIIAKLREADVELGRGLSVGQVCRRLEVSEHKYYRWRKEYGGLKVGQAKQLKELDRENVRLNHPPGATGSVRSGAPLAGSSLPLCL